MSKMAVSPRLTYGARAAAVLFCCLTVLPTGTPRAQETVSVQGPVVVERVEAPRVTASGKATVYSTPTHVQFWLHKMITAEQLDLAVKESANVDPAVREIVTARELHPTVLETAMPAITALAENQVRVSTELQFSMSPYAMGENSSIKFAELCEQLKEIAATLGSELSGPIFITTERSAVTQDAVQEAAKEAYPAAVGAAAALNVAVRAVDLVEVVTITWNAPPDTEATFPTLAQIACTAEVRVTYTLE